MARIIQNVRRRMSDMFDPFGAGTLMMNDPYFNNTFYNTQVYKDVPVHLQSAPLKITVTDLPEKGKTDNFGGAVGNYSVTARIDKKELSTDDVATLILNINSVYVLQPGYQQLRDRRDRTDEGACKPRQKLHEPQARQLGIVQRHSRHH